ncbi:DNA-binding transcriptional regulator, AcrR family [Ferrimonas sediminum]|uniref:DNA-binding transcriptional regulator, AcrR family n=1 Tax=Ferrimonas sediminum TaxID=718193 RepID=A0A1G8VFY0_9GAMM|nr:TetR/AcrR family transcriptional regulator [Ferrimonas sediminum]SDJ64963.1 DNA-binding transcriptional regulator, AcrR family [Ferrimonas sediminum]
MARQCQFDHHQVLEQAMQLFWKQGYEATSVADLVTQLQINRFSLYNSFGDKQQLYHLSLQHYLDQHSLPRLKPLFQPNADLSTLTDFINQMAADPDNACLGCYIQAALLERRHLDPHVKELADQLFAAVREGFEHCLLQAQQQGQIAAGRHIAELSAWLLLQIQGIRVLLRAGQHDTLASAVKQIVTFLTRP